MPKLSITVYTQAKVVERVGSKLYTGNGGPIIFTDTYDDAAFTDRQKHMMRLLNAALGIDEHIRIWGVGSLRTYQSTKSGSTECRNYWLDVTFMPEE